MSYVNKVAGVYSEIVPLLCRAERLWHFFKKNLYIVGAYIVISPEMKNMSDIRMPTERFSDPQSSVPAVFF